jgi:hypothetical protein
LHVCRPYDAVLPLPSPPLVLPPANVHTPPSPHDLSTSAGRQYAPDTYAQSPHTVLATAPSICVFPQVACTHVVAPPAQGCPIWLTGHGDSADAGAAAASTRAHASPPRIVVRRFLIGAAPARTLPLWGEPDKAKRAARSGCLVHAKRPTGGTVDSSTIPRGRGDWIRTSDPLTPSQVR